MHARRFFLTLVFTMFLIVPLLVSVVQAAPSTVITDSPVSGPTPSRTPTMITPTPCPVVPNPVKLLSPANNSSYPRNRVPLSWSDSTCAIYYTVTITKPGVLGIVDQTKVYTTHYTTIALTANKTYVWSVQACDFKGCAKSAVYSFYVGSK